MVFCVESFSNVFEYFTYWSANAFARLTARSELCATTVKCNVLAVESAATVEIDTNCWGVIESPFTRGSWTVFFATCVEDPMVACVAT